MAVLIGLLLLAPVNNGKKRSSMVPRIETDRYPASGIELAAKAQRARYREKAFT